jgi:membrane protein implicated in regulation of membrane protease activity
MLDDFLREWMSGEPSKTGITFGRGVLGKTAPVVGVGLVAMGTIAFSIDNIWIQLGLAVLIAGVVIYYLHKAFAYAHEHPNHALLEDANLVRALKIEQAAKDKRITIDANAEPIPNPALLEGKKNG